MPVRLMNHGNAPVKLYPGMGIGYLERINFNAAIMDSPTDLRVNTLCTEENVPREKEYWPKETKWARDLPQYPVKNDDNWLAKLDSQLRYVQREQKSAAAAS